MKSHCKFVAKSLYPMFMILDYIIPRLRIVVTQLLVMIKTAFSPFQRQNFFTLASNLIFFISDKATNVSLRERGIFILYPLFRKNPGGKKILFFVSYS